ncbi:putative serine/threonine-protein kinase [Forsythia ovata]|uniref:O-fucosyltransferase family protein n=1 Tax=Forsythia ovata TaxID=205694 RepID=A0ABD1VLL4_9LAMI
MVVVSGGMNQRRNQIVDAVVIARILGAALVVPILQVNVIWGDEIGFGTSISSVSADLMEHEQIGQGTYSTVFRARDLESWKIVAFKKVRFDNFEPESVRFMAREIMILRRLDHPNIINLEAVFIIVELGPWN